MPFAMLLIVFMCAFICFTFRRDSLEYNYEQIDSNLTYSLLAAAIINLHEYAESGNLLVSDGGEPTVWDAAFTNSYVRFVDCLKSNLGLNESMETTKGQGLSGGVEIVSYRIYNYVTDKNGQHVTECGIKNGQPYMQRYPDNTDVYVAANDGMVKITETSVCAQISFTLEGIGSYNLTRLVAVTDG